MGPGVSLPLSTTDTVLGPMFGVPLPVIYRGGVSDTGKWTRQSLLHSVFACCVVVCVGELVPVTSSHCCVSSSGLSTP